jgi:hypothetical protein
MMQEPTFLDCCDTVSLRPVLVLYESNHDLEALKICAACHAYWFYRFSEYVDWSGGDDDLTSWYTRLSAEEGAALTHADRTTVDLAYLRHRPSWMDDRDGVRRVPGAPDHPAS